MKILFFALLLLSFIPIFWSFRQNQSDKRGQYIYTAYLISFLVFMYCAIFRDLYFGYELGDLFFYSIFLFAMIISNLGIGLRKRIGRELKYLFSTINIVATVYLILMLCKSIR